MEPPLVAIAAPAPLEDPTARPPPRPALLWALAAAGCAAGASSLLFALTNEGIGTELGEPLVIALLADWITLSYVFCGLVAWWRRPASRFGPLLLVAGAANYVTTFSWTTNDVAFTIGQSFDLLPPVLFLHVFLAFPSGRLESTFERGLVALAYGVAIGLQLFRMAFGGFGPHNLLEVAPNQALTDAATHVQLLVVSAACLGGIGVLATRRRRAGRPLRRSLALVVDAFALGLVMIAFLFVSLVVGGPAVPQIRWATFVTLGLAPVAFLVALLHSRLARSSVGDLFVELRSDPAPGELRSAIARALRDPSATLAYWLPEFGLYADLDARPVELPEGGRQATTLIDRDGGRVAALLHDRSLLDEPELLAAVTAAAGIAIENARLHVEVRARLEELRGSRARIVEAGQKERQRLERNLHDGAQQRLVALSLELRLLEERLADDPEARRRLDLARREVSASLEELRELAHGLHPAVVSGHGLAVALESLAARAPVPVRLTVVTDGRLPEALEIAAYYLVAETLANVGKYAHASAVSVDVTRAGSAVVIEVADDGVGGADTERGTGLRGLADRVETLGGRLRIWSPAGGGTRVRAEIPCVP
ncbi:MAG TPA: histidine kinase [Gaiellaceae bacterium]|nr:histidine kinase [Gaiellaceae bacterium]